MHNDVNAAKSRPIVAANPKSGVGIDGVVFTGSGRAVVKAVAAHAGLESLDVLEAIVTRFLVKKGADWTAPILSEYVGLYDDSLGTFCLVWDDTTGQLAAHGSIFQSRRQPWAALLAHIRTADEFRGLGLGTLVTEEVTSAAFRQGAGLVILATDDKLHRVAQGERAAHSMYSKIGYAILGERRLADTIDWLMAVDQPFFQEVQRQKTAAGGQLASVSDHEMTLAKRRLVERVRAKFSSVQSGTIEPVGAGDLASLFLLLNLCPENDWKLKLLSWQIQHGPEAERTFITTVRQAIVDQDRLHDASFVLRNDDGAIAAICAAQLVAPFSQQTYAIDMYCLPALLEAAPERIHELVRRTIEHIGSSPMAPRPCWLAFTGIDSDKIQLFESLGFTASDRTTSYGLPDGAAVLEAREYRLQLA